MRPAAKAGPHRRSLRGEEGRYPLAFSDADRLTQHADTDTACGRAFGQEATKCARPRPAVVEAKDVAGDVVKPSAAAQVSLSVGHERLQHVAAGGGCKPPPEEAAVD